MKRKITGGSIVLAALFIASVATIGTVIVVYFLKPMFEREAYKREFLAPFHEVYDDLRDKFPSIISLSEHLGAGGDRYCMYYIECDIDENTDCFAEFVDIQREINALMKARKEDEWFSEFHGHIVINAGSRRLKTYYWNGSISRTFEAYDIISDEYGVLWDAFPENDDIYLYIRLTDYSDEIKSEIMQKNEGRNIDVEPSPYSERAALASDS